MTRVVLSDAGAMTTLFQPWLFQYSVLHVPVSSFDGRFHCCGPDFSFEIGALSSTLPAHEFNSRKLHQYTIDDQLRGVVVFMWFRVVMGMWKTGVAQRAGFMESSVRLISHEQRRFD